MSLFFIFLLVFLVILFKSPWIKGKVGEFVVHTANGIHLDKNIYTSIKNITLQLVDGSTTQIDHVVVSKYGIFVIETKNMKGWIFGSEHQKQWTQQLYKEKFYFQNPLHQNYRHIKALEEALNLPPSCFTSVVVFVGECKFKTDLPDNVFKNGQYASYILSFQDERLNPLELRQTLGKLERKGLKPSFKTDKEHVANLRARKQKETLHVKTETLTCKRCGKDMVLRHNRKTGEPFYGCSGYPKCRNVVGGKVKG